MRRKNIYTRAPSVHATWPFGRLVVNLQPKLSEQAVDGIILYNISLLDSFRWLLYSSYSIVVVFAHGMIHSFVYRLLSAQNYAGR